MRLFVSSTSQTHNISVAKFERRRAGATSDSMFGSAESGLLKELGAERVRQVFRNAISIAIMCGSNARVAGMSHIVFRSTQLSLMYIMPGS